jgi:putative transcriptional regulator
MAKQRTRRKISQAELAEAVGVSRQSVTLIESGRYLPSLPLAFTIARFLGQTVDEMFRPDEKEKRHACQRRVNQTLATSLRCHVHPSA